MSMTTRRELEALMKLLMKKDGATVSSDVLVKICTALECTLDDIVEIVPDNK